MSSKIKFAIFLIATGAALVVAAHDRFVTIESFKAVQSGIKTDLGDIKKKLEIIDDRLYRMNKKK